MITNWYRTNIDPGFLSRRLRVAYTMWLWETVNCEDQLPTLDQLKARRLYSEIEPYLAVIEGPAGIEARAFTYSYVGRGIEEIYGQKLIGRPMDDILTDAGRTLAEESYAALRKERRPVHLGIRGSPLVSKEIEVIVMPLRHPDEGMELAGLIYEYDENMSETSP